MLEAAVEALATAFDPLRLLWVMAGVSIGLVVGLIPGLGGAVGMSIVLPFIFGMDPFSGIALLIGMIAVIHTADTFPAVLLGIPGSAGSQATIVDGYPMAQAGEANKALGAAFMSSAIGGLLGAIVLFGAISIARPLVTALGSPQLFMLGVLGLSMVGVLARGSALAGIASALFGLLLSTIGGAPAVPAYRFTFDFLYLYGGISLALVALGLFALPELLDLLASGQSIASKGVKSGSTLVSGLRTALRHKVLIARSSMLGALMGIIPGVGGSIVDWFNYGLTAQTSRDNARFGHGDIRGVIAPESANNAKEGGSLIPTLLFGIPGSVTSGVLLGGLLLMGIEVGPSLVTQRLDILLAIIWTLAIANIVGVVACLLLTKQAARLATIPAHRLVPFLLVLLVVASYQSSRHWGDILTFLLIGLLGWVMKQAGWPRPPMLIGFVLGPTLERYLHLSTSRYGRDWWTDPIVLSLAVITIAVIAIGVVGSRRQIEALAGAES